MTGLGRDAPLVRVVDLLLVIRATAVIRAIQLMVEALKLGYGPNAIASLATRARAALMN